MRRLAIWVGCAILVWPISSCQRQTGQSKILLPPEVAGTWKAKGSPWKIVITPNGRIDSAIIPMGKVEVKPNRTTKFEMMHGEFSTYKTGRCDLEYTPQTRELFVSIEIKKMHIAFPDDAIDGNSIDRFTGPVSEDGKTWIADWVQLFDYGPRFPQDPNDAYNGPVMFEKLED